MMTLELILEIVKAVFVFLFALAISSFLNVVIYRLPLKMNLSYPASHCPTCGHALAVKDNVPIFSYLFLRGKCRYCHTPISPRYMIVEAFGAFTVLANYFYLGLTPLFFLTSILIFLFIVIFFIDLEHYFIPDSLNLIVFLLGCVSLFFGNRIVGSISYNLQDKLYSLILNGTLVLLFYTLEKVFDKELIGGGDLKLFFGMGLFLGAKLEFLGIFFASCLALIVETLFKKSLKRKTLAEVNEEDDSKNQKKAIPFGPYLTVGFLLAFYLGPILIHWYVNTFLIF